MATGMERLRFMIGAWDIQASIMGEDGTWMDTPLPKETTILPLLCGAFHREELSVSYGEKTIHLFFTWSYDKYREVFRMISCDDAEGLMKVLEGNFEDSTDTVVISDVRTGTSMLDEEGRESFMRLASTKTSEDGFTDVVSESLDGGQSWSPVFRAVHTRKRGESFE